MQRMTIALSMLLAAGFLFVAGAGGEPADDDRDVLKGPSEKSQQRRSNRKFDGERRRGGGGRDRGDFGRRMMEDLNLTQEQKEKVHEIMKAQHEKSKGWREANAEELKEIEEQMKALHERRRKLMKGAPKPTDAFAQIRPLLDAEQQEALDEKFERIKQHMQKHDRRSKAGEKGKRGRPEGKRQRGERQRPDDTKKQDASSDKLDL